MKCGERGWNLKRAINVRMGLTRANDRLPKALLEPYKEGGSAGFVPDLPAMLEAYYEARGWDKETGKPSKAKLIELGLDEMRQRSYGVWLEDRKLWRGLNKNWIFHVVAFHDPAHFA